MDIPVALRAPLLAGLCGLVVAWALYRFFAGIRDARLIADTPLVRIRSAAQGYVKAYGRARAVTAEPSRSPLTLKPCVWWTYAIARRDRDRSSSSAWRSVESATSIEPFVLDDGDGTCLVGPVCATVLPSVTHVWYGNTPWPEGPPGLFQTFLQSGTYRYTESRLDLDSQVTVVGELRSRSEVGNVDAEAGARLREWKQDQVALQARFDADHDGRISTTEWEAARAAAVAEAQAQVMGSDVKRMTMIEQPTNGEAFIIAPMDSEHLVRRERLRSASFLALGLGTIFAWSLLSRLPWFD